MTNILQELHTNGNSSISSIDLTDDIIRSRSRYNNIESLKTLNLWGCNLNNISALSKLTNLRVLSLSSNIISDLSPLRSCTKLRELYIRNNDIKDFSEIKQLEGLKFIRAIWLSENPCVLGKSVRDYAQDLLGIFPRLKFIDGQTIEQVMESTEKGSNLYRAILLLIQDLSPEEMYSIYNELGKRVFSTHHNTH